MTWSDDLVAAIEKPDWDKVGAIIEGRDRDDEVCAAQVMVAMNLKLTGTIVKVPLEKIYEKIECKHPSWVAKPDGGGHHLPPPVGSHRMSPIWYEHGAPHALWLTPTGDWGIYGCS